MPHSLLSILYSVGFVGLVLWLLSFPKPENENYLDVFWLYSFIVLFFLLTWILRPELRYFYERETFGVLDSVFMFRRGIYAYLVIRLLSDGTQLDFALKTLAILNVILFTLQFIKANIQGYWLIVSPTGNLMKAPYQLGFGYDVLLISMIFLWWGFYKKGPWLIKLLFFWSAIIIARGGSRGALLFLIFSVLLLIAISLIQQKKFKTLFIVVISGAILAVLGFVILKYLAGTILPALNQSRTLKLILSGEFLYDNGRIRIWTTVFNKMRDNYYLPGGPFSERPVVAPINIAGYSHNVFVEILIDFGLFFGIIIIIALAYFSLKMFIKCKNEEILGAFFVFFVSSMALLTSLTFWNYPPFWACLGLIVNGYKQNVLAVTPKFKKRLKRIKQET